MWQTGKPGSRCQQLTSRKIAVGIQIQSIRDGLVRVDDLVKMNLAISKSRSRDLYATDASGTDPGSLLGGCSLGGDDTGNAVLRRDYRLGSFSKTSAGGHLSIPKFMFFLMRYCAS